MPAVPRPYAYAVCLLLALSPRSLAATPPPGAPASGAAPAAPAGFPTLAPLPGTGALGTPSNGSSFTFVVAGDDRPHHASDPLPPTLTTIVKAIAGMTGPAAPAFAVWTGDTIYGKAPDDEKTMQAEYAAFLGAVKGAGVPVFSAPGNHELNLVAQPHCRKQKPVDEPDPSGNLLRYWQASMGLPYGVFRYGNSAFVTVNTDDTVGPGVKVPTCKYAGYVGPGQLAALQATLASLAADPSVAHVFVFMHRPVHASPVDPKSKLWDDSRKPLEKVLDDPKYANVSFVFASHQHLFYYHDKKHPYATGPFQRTDPAGKKPDYAVSGGAGAPLNKKATPQTGGFNHYLVVTVDGAKVTVTVQKV